GGGPLINVTANVSTGTPEFHYNWSVSPRIWLGIQSESGLGVRARWFHYDRPADNVSAISSAAGRANQNLAPFPNQSTVTTATDATGTISGVTTGTVTVPGNGAFTTGVNPLFDRFITTGDPLAVSSGLFIDAWDFEATAAGRWCQIDLVGSAGVRYAFV